MGNRDARSGRLDRNLRLEDRDRVRVLTLDRPDVRNAFDIPLYDAVREALADASVSANIGACVLTGTGPVFSAGMDLSARQPGSRTEFTEHGFVPFARALATFDKPLLVAVNGAGNTRGRPAGSGFWVASMDKGQCGIPAGSMWGCRFNASGTATACGVATIDQKNNDVIIVTEQK